MLGVLCWTLILEWSGQIKANKEVELLLSKNKSNLDFSTGFEKMAACLSFSLFVHLIVVFVCYVDVSNRYKSHSFPIKVRGKRPIIKIYIYHGGHSIYNSLYLEKKLKLVFEVLFLQTVMLETIVIYSLLCLLHFYGFLFLFLSIFLFSVIVFMSNQVLVSLITTWLVELTSVQMEWL